VIVSRKRCKIETLLQWKSNRKSYVVYRMAPLPLNDLEGHFCCLNFETFLAPISRETWHEFTNISRLAVPLFIVDRGGESRVGSC